MHKILLGIEHLMTGVQVRSPKGDVLTFQRESASVVRVISDSEMEMYWPVKQCWLSSTEFDNEVEKHSQIKYGEGEIEWYAQVMAGQMVRTDEAFTPIIKDHPVPYAVVKSIRAKFGANADDVLCTLKYYGGYYGFTWGNMFVGVEPDGYMHT